MSNKVLAKRKAEQMINEHSLCEFCGTNHRLTIDHIIPIQILKDMGFTKEEMFDDEENLRLICRKCNALKSNHLDFTDQRTKQLLIKYLKQF